MPRLNIATELGVIQADANKLHDEIEHFLNIYRQTLSEINAVNGVTVSLRKLQTEMDRIYFQDLQTRVDIWVGTPNNPVCGDALTAELDLAYEKAGDDLSICAVVLDGEVTDASTPVLDKIDELQADSTYMQFATVFGIRVHNVFSKPEYTADELSYKVETFRRIWEEDISVEFTTKLANYRERFAVINLVWNNCLQEAGDRFEAEATRLEGEITSCA